MNGKTYWLDATAQICPLGTDSRRRSRRGMSSSSKTAARANGRSIPDGTPDDNRTDQTVKLDPQGRRFGERAPSPSPVPGDVDMGLRAALQYLPPDKLRPYMEQIAQNIGTDPTVTNINLSDFRDLDKPVSITMSVNFPSWANDSDQVLIFKARPEQSKGESSSPFREDTRHLPIEQTSAARTVSVLQVKLPDGYDVLSMPKDRDIKSDLGRFQRTVTQNGDVLSIQTIGEAFHAEVPTFDYGSVRQYYHDYLRAFDQMVIVKKK